MICLFDFEKFSTESRFPFFCIIIKFTLYTCTLGMCRGESPIFNPSALEHTILKNYQIFLSGASPFYPFSVPETIIFKISLRSSHSSPPTAGFLRTGVSGRLYAMYTYSASPRGTVSQKVIFLYGLLQLPLLLLFTLLTPYR